MYTYLCSFIGANLLTSCRVKALQLFCLITRRARSCILNIAGREKEVAKINRDIGGRGNGNSDGML